MVRFFSLRSTTLFKFAPVVSRFFQAYTHPLENEVFKKILTQAVNCAKSTNLVVRANSVELFKTLIATEHANQADDARRLEYAVTELLSLPKSGKTTGPDHRVTLYSMLASLSPRTASISSSIIQTASPLLAKETHDAATAVLASALPPHVKFLLAADSPLPADTIALIAKEMNNPKPVIRKAFCTLAGHALWSESDSKTSSPAALAFAQALLPAFENSLKTVSSNPLNSVGGPLEGYIAIAVLLGPVLRFGKFGMSIFRLESFLKY